MAPVRSGKKGTSSPESTTSQTNLYKTARELQAYALCYEYAPWTGPLGHIVSVWG